LITCTGAETPVRRWISDAQSDGIEDAAAAQGVLASARST